MRLLDSFPSTPGEICDLQCRVVRRGGKLKGAAVTMLPAGARRGVVAVDALRMRDRYRKCRMGLSELLKFGNLEVVCVASESFCPVFESLLRFWSENLLENTKSLTKAER